MNFKKNGVRNRNPPVPEKKSMKKSKKNFEKTNNKPTFDHSIRIAGTIRDFRTHKFAQKDGLLAAFLRFFLSTKEKIGFLRLFFL